MNESNHDRQSLLSGLDGANPLGFLAALGTLITLRQAGATDARLGWKRSVTWVPVVYGISAADPLAMCESLSGALHGKEVHPDANSTREAMQREFAAAKKAEQDKKKEIGTRGLRYNERKEAVEAEVSPLQERLQQKRQAWLAALKDAVPSPELAIGKRIDCTNDEFRGHAAGFLADGRHTNRKTLDLLAAFGSDACLQKSGRIEATPFCFITGSGHQYFLDTVRQLIDAATADKIYAALFEPWTYRDEKLSMRWDPSEDRRYALLDRDPTSTGNKPRTMWMANLLAYRALILFPSAPGIRSLATTAWSPPSDEPTFTWPIWKCPADPDTIRSLLQLSELNSPEMDHSILRARGIAAAFRARRIKVGNPPNYKINFSPARSVL